MVDSRFLGGSPASGWRHATHASVRWRMAGCYYRAGTNELEARAE
jgi:hypothetical protein